MVMCSELVVLLGETPNKVLQIKLKDFLPATFIDPTQTKEHRKKNGSFSLRCFTFLGTYRTFLYKYLSRKKKPKTFLTSQMR